MSRVARLTRPPRTGVLILILTGAACLSSYHTTVPKIHSDILSSDTENQLVSLVFLQ